MKTSAPAVAKLDAVPVAAIVIVVVVANSGDFHVAALEERRELYNAMIKRAHCDFLAHHARVHRRRTARLLLLARNLQNSVRMLKHTHN